MKLTAFSTLLFLSPDFYTFLKVQDLVVKLNM